MESTESQIIETAFNHGPWATLSVALVCALAGFLAISLKNYLNKKESRGCSNEELKEDIKGVKANITLLFEKIDKLSAEISTLRSELAFMQGQLGKRAP